jgi:predicted ATPase
MIDSLRLIGFKGFEDEEITMGGVTLLSGLNNSGKSSVIQALRMFCQSSEGKSPLLPGHGTVDELRARRAKPGSSINISVSRPRGEQDKTLETLSLTMGGHEAPENAPVACYVGADRHGPRTTLPIERSLGGMPCIGDKGEFVLDFLGRLRETLLPEAMHHKNSEGSTLNFEIQGWLNEIAPGVKFSFELDEKRDSAHAVIDELRPTNVGFGISYTMPILAALLGMTAGPPQGGWGDEWGTRWENMKQNQGVLVMLENPEAHLHPKGQTAMGELIVKAAACGIQIVVETHSDHLMDGIRIAVKKELIDSAKINFHFFERNTEDQCTFTSPKLHPNGKLEFWPDGFFDQALKNRAILASRR